jgi:hypothetical protein
MTYYKFDVTLDESMFELILDLPPIYSRWSTTVDHPEMYIFMVYDNNRA